MAKFTDGRGRQWQLRLNVPVMRLVKDQLDVHLGKLLTDEINPLIDLCSDPIQFVDVLAVMTREQRHDQGVSDADFGESLVGDTLEDAIESFLRALADFCPRHQRRVILRLVDTMHRISQELEDQEEESPTYSTSVSSTRASAELIQPITR